MPLGGTNTKICEIQYLDTQKSGFVTTGKKCTDNQFDTNDNCYYYDWVFEDEYDECNWYYEDEYQFEFEGEKKFLEDFGIWCKPYQRDST